MESMLALVGLVFAIVAVKLGDASVVVSPSTSTIIPGLAVKIKCTVAGGESYKEWFNETSGTKVAAKYVKEETAGSVYNLEVPGGEVSPYFGGEYTCKGSTNSAKTTLKTSFCNNNYVEFGKTPERFQLGESGKIMVGCHAFPQPTYKWTKDGKPLPITGRFSADSHGSVTIPNVEKSDEGSYGVTFIWQSNEFTEKFITITVGERPVFTHQPPLPKEVTGVIGFNATFCCKATGDETPVISWTKKASSSDAAIPVDTSNVNKYEIKDGCLVIKNIQDPDKASYTCKAKNLLGEITTSVTMKEVKEPPKITSNLQDVTKGVGEDHSITCAASGAPILSVEWRENGKAVLNQKKTAGQSVLSFKGLRLDQSATLTCVAKNGLRFNNKEIVDSKSIKLTVQSKPVVNLQASKTPVYSFIGSETAVTLRCRFSGYPDPDVSMKKDGKEVAKGKFTAELSIKPTNESDFGMYECEATNSLGTAKHTVELKQAVVPGKPINVKESMTTCNTITVTWKPPKSNGGKLILQYILSYGVKGTIIRKEINVKETTRSFKIESDNAVTIKANTDYTVLIQARNAVGAGNARTMEVKTKQYCTTSPPRVSNRDLVVAGKEIELTWEAPKKDGFDPAIKYRVEWAMTSSPNKTQKSPVLEVMKYTITDLEAGKYIVRLFAINKAGESNPDERIFEVKGEEVKPTTPGSEGGPPKVGKRTGGLSKGAVAGIVIAVLLIVLITIDLFCCFFNSCGIIFCFQKALCRGGKGEKYVEDGKTNDKTEMEKLKNEENV